MTAPQQQMRNPFSGKVERLPLIVGMDPGEHKGYALIDTEDVVERGRLTAPRAICLATSIEPIQKMLASGARDARYRPVWSMVELQYTSRISTGEISPESIVKLAFRAGFMLREAHGLPNAVEMFAAPPAAWKCQIFPSGGTMRKDVFCEKVRRQLMPQEEAMLAKLEDTHRQDVLDGVAIAWSLWCALTTPDLGLTIEGWRVWPGHILPKSARAPRKMGKAAREKLGI